MSHANRQVQRKHGEIHKSQRIGWLRAAVLGANDGIVSISSLVIGVAAGQSTPQQILLSGIAGLAAGAFSMAAGEYVSVSSQADTEKSDLEVEKMEIEKDISFETEELAQIYVKRGLDATLAREVAQQLMAKNALEAHARDELGIIQAMEARPIQAAFSSAAAFAMGAALPLTVAGLSPQQHMILWVSTVSLVSLAILGLLAAVAGGANILKSVCRVVFWGGIAMAVTAFVGKLFQVSGGL